MASSSSDKKQKLELQPWELELPVRTPPPPNPSGDEEESAGQRFPHPPRYLPVSPSHPLYMKEITGPVIIATDRRPPPWDPTPSPAEQLYSKALEETQGFDMPGLSPAIRYCNPIYPISLEWDEERIQRFSAEAIRHYNDEHGTHYSVVEVENVMEQLVSGLNYYITFKAKLGDDEPITSPATTIQTFEALVNEYLDQVTVALCRLQGDKQVPVF